MAEEIIEKWGVVIKAVTVIGLVLVIGWLIWADRHNADNGWEDE